MAETKRSWGRRWSLLVPAAVLAELPRLGGLEVFERVNRRMVDALAEWIAERRDEVASILARGLIRAVAASRPRAGIRSDLAPTCLDLPGDPGHL